MRRRCLHMHIGLFGGTFNPIHDGHILAAKEVKEALALDKIFFIPSALPPHKAPANLAGTNERLEMIRLAIEPFAYFCLSDVELKRPGPSYTIDTVRFFISTYPENTRFYLIMGLDAFLEIETWKSYRDLFSLIPLVVVSRPGVGAETPRKHVETYLTVKISHRYSFSDVHGCFVHPEKKTVYCLEITPMDISATQIRLFIKTGKSIQGLVPESVEHFIKNKGLYR